MSDRDQPVIQPCSFMKGLLNRMVDGSLRGPLSWYARAHVNKCEKCGPAYKALLALRQGLKSVGQDKLAEGLLSEDRWQAIQEACDH